MGLEVCLFSQKEGNLNFLRKKGEVGKIGKEVPKESNLSLLLIFVFVNVSPRNNDTRVTSFNLHPILLEQIISKLKFEKMLLQNLASSHVEASRFFSIQLQPSEEQIGKVIKLLKERRKLSYDVGAE